MKGQTVTEGPCSLKKILKYVILLILLLQNIISLILVYFIKTFLLPSILVDGLHLEAPLYH